MYVVIRRAYRKSEGRLTRDILAKSRGIYVHIAIVASGWKLFREIPPFPNFYLAPSLRVTSHDSRFQHALISLTNRRDATL